MRIIFFNHWHYGDLHVSRSFVQAICNHVDAEFVYAHNNSSIFGGAIKEDKTLLKGLDKWEPFLKRGNDVFINTWYGAKKRAFIDKETISFSCLYSLFEFTCKNALNLNLKNIHPDPKEFYPSIDFKLYKTDGIDSFMEKYKNNKKVLICNGDVQSCQAKNFDMLPSVHALAKKHKNILWLVTNKNVKTHNNVIYTPDIIQKSGTDLNENAYISTFCDLVVGKLSGVHTFSLIKDNLFDRKMVMLSFFKCGRKVLPHADWIGNRFRNKIKYSSTILESENTDTNMVVKDINRAVKQL